MYLFKDFSGQLIYMFSMSLVNIMLIRYASNSCEPQQPHPLSAERRVPLNGYSFFSQDELKAQYKINKLNSESCKSMSGESLIKHMDVKIRIIHLL